MRAKGKTMSKEETQVEYPRHWWFTCSKFTCYIETDKEDKIGPRSNGVARHYVGEKARRFAKRVQQKFGGVCVNEYDAKGKLL
jgi:hypothetical protein